VADTGNGATLTLSSGFTANLTSIGGAEPEVPDVNDSHLGLAAGSYETYQPGDLIEAGEQEFEIHYNPNDPPTLRTVQTCTITYPVPSGLTNGATKAGTGYIKKFKEPDLKNNELMTGVITWKWDGKTGPAFADAS
jgi:hypothetical protein